MTTMKLEVEIDSAYAERDTVFLNFSYLYEIWANALLHVESNECTITYLPDESLRELSPPKGVASAKVRLANFNADRVSIVFYTRIEGGGGESERVVRIIGKDGQIYADEGDDA